MRLLPKVPFAGKLLRFRGGDTLEVLISNLGIPVEVVEDSRWIGFWNTTPEPLNPGDSPASDGSYYYPFLARASQDRYMLLSTETSNVDRFVGSLMQGRKIEPPRINVDRLARELVAPKEGESALGRRYTLGAVNAQVEGYGRALRSASFYGDDLADTALFRNNLQQLVITRVTVRDPMIDRELMSISSNGGVDFHDRGASHLLLIDSLMSFIRAGGYMEWREGRAWRAY